MKIYIAGKITGDPDHKEKFAHAEHQLINDGNIVINPAILPPGFTQEQYMKVCIPMLDMCEAIYLLKGWETSAGANTEREYAEYTGKIILLEK